MKAQGNEALKNGKNDEAIRLYTEALTLDETNEVLYSNRSAVYAKQKDYIKALDDAEKAIEAKPSWSKVYIYNTFLAVLWESGLHAIYMI